jgi:hypothetical protein
MAALFGKKAELSCVPKARHFIIREVVYVVHAHRFVDAD